ncbi:MAG: hypothetical protein ACXWLB_09055 [Reyranella sp.]
MAAALAATSAALPAYAASDADCQAMWTAADTNKDGVLSDAESMRYAAAMRVRETTMATDGTITHAAFMDACKSDVYAPTKADAGAPLKGANSFTEGQAKDRAVANGATEVAELKKDDNGVWRGMAKQDGKSGQVAVDYKGNVVFQTSP